MNAKKLERIITVLILSAFIGIFLDSCCGESYSYRWEYIITQSLDKREVTEIDSVAALDFGVRVNCVSQKFRYASFNLNISNLYATSCTSFYANLDSIVDLRIFTIHNFNSYTPANTNVTDYFTGKVGSKSNLSCEELIQEINLTEYFEVTNFDLYLEHDVDVPTYQNFKIEIEFSDNRLLEAETGEIWLY